MHGSDEKRSFGSSTTRKVVQKLDSAAKRLDDPAKSPDGEVVQ